MVYDKHTNIQCIPVNKRSPHHIYFRNFTEKHDVTYHDIPSVLTVNASHLSDWAYVKLTEIPKQLMYVRVIVNTWNLDLVHSVVHWYISKKVPVVLSFAKYEDYGSIPVFHQDDYFLSDGKWIIKVSAWLLVMVRFNKDPRVYSCGQSGLSDKCSDCGHCIREYYNTIERLSNG